MRKLVHAVVALLPLGLLPAFVNAPAAMIQECAGVGLAPSGSKDWISCAGDCDGGPTCQVGDATDAIGRYKFCGCGPVGAPIEPSCCHLVARKSGNDPVVLAVRGLCTNASPDCSDADGLTCQLTNDQPVCKP